ncbi:MAG: hypothetical protein ACI9BD_000997, partial [Candidatus Marinamargulisbacteria bacterium]
PGPVEGAFFGVNDAVLFGPWCICCAIDGVETEFRAIETSPFLSSG